MYTVINPSVSTFSKVVNTIPAYTFFTGELSSYKGLFFKGFSGAMINFCPGGQPVTWDTLGTSTQLVRNYQEVDVELVVKIQQP